MHPMSSQPRRALTVPSIVAQDRPEPPPLAIRTIAMIVALHLALHMYVLAITQFGVHRDEFLYFAMGRHIRLWRMDFPPLIAILANLSRTIFGDRLGAVRVFPALEGAVLIVLAAAIAREFAGGRFAQALAAISVLAAPIYLRASTLFQPVILDQIWWTVALLGLVRLTRPNDPRWWWVIGSGLGLGLLTKFSVVFVGVGLVVSLLLTTERRWLLTRWPWIAAGLALVMGSPSIIGQLRLGFPVVGQMHDLQETQLTHVSWLSFIAEQPLLIGPVAWAVALTGIVALVGWERFARYRVVGLTCLFAFVLLVVLHGKSYYAGPIYPTLLAAGGVVLERIRRPLVGAAVRSGTIAIVTALGGVVLPIAVPMLSPEATARYAMRLGVGAAVRTNRGDMERLPQDFADMLGWEEQARALASAYRSLEPEEQRQAVIVGNNYGEAGAAEFYGRRYGLPPVVSTAGSFWFFGPGERPGQVAVTIGETIAGMQRFYGDVRASHHLVSPWSVREERDLEVLIARQPRTTLQAIWDSERGRH